MAFQTQKEKRMATRTLTARSTRANTRRDLTPAIELLKKLAAYELEPGIDRLMLELGENKESLTPAQHRVLADLVEFTQQRTIEKFEARVALQRLKHFVPQLVDDL